MTETLGYELRRLRLMRLALTRATAKWSTGGRIKTQGKPRPITLAGDKMKSWVHVVMQNGAPVGAFLRRDNAVAYSREIGGPGRGHAIGIVTLEVQDGPRTHPGEEHQLDEPRPRQEERR